MERQASIDLGSNRKKEDTGLRCGGRGKSEISSAL